MRHLFTALTDYLRGSFLMQWLLANVLGWTLSLHLLGLAVRNNSILLIIVYGTAGVLVSGIAQWWVLADHLPISWSWIMVTAAAVAGSGVLNFGLSFITLRFEDLVQHILVGGFAGLLMGIIQSFLLRRHFRMLRLWIAVNLIGGASCALISLPLVLTHALLGAAVLGLLTGYALLIMGRASHSYASIHSE
ncbi:MAG: hypothetical protein R3E39_13555 [Anaerolineae bacterium]